MAEYAAGVYQRTAEALKHTAELADEHALRQEQAGRSGAAQAEHAAAQRAFQAAQRAHKAADRARQKAQRIRRSLAEDSPPSPHPNKQHRT